MEYESETSFNQVPRFRCVEDPLLTFFDPSAKEATKSDGRYCGEMITYSRLEFKDKFPDSKYAEDGMLPMSFPSNQINDVIDQNYWMGEEYIRVANYYVKETFPMTIALLSDGRSMPLNQAEEEVEAARKIASRVKRKENKLKSMMGTLGFKLNDKSYFDDYEHLEIVDTRETIDFKIMNYVMTQDEVLESAEWPSKIMPLIFVDGHSQYIDGKQITKSYHRTAKDSQKMVNYTASEAIEGLTNSHKSQWIGTPENFKGYEEMWSNPSLSAGALIANPDVITGAMPMQNPPPQVSPSFMQIFQQSAQDIKSTLGYFESNSGAEGGETSGRMVRDRAQQGSMASFVYYDNTGRAIEQLSKCVMSLIPTLYDSTRHVMTRNKSGDQKMMPINQPNGEDFMNDLTKGTFGIEVKIGSNYELQKQENLQQIKELMELIAPLNPQIAGGLFDLAVANTDLENTAQMVDRVRQMILGKSPAEIMREEMDIPPEQKKANPQMEAAQMDMQLKQQEMQLKQQDLQLKAQQMEQDHAKAMADIEMKQKEIDLKAQQVEMENKKIDAAMRNTHVEMYKADKSLEEIKATNATERYNSDKDLEVAKVQADATKFGHLTSAHAASAGIHEKHVEGMHNRYAIDKQSKHEKNESKAKEKEENREEMK